MTAASFWSLLAPALEITEETHQSLAFVPVGFGFVAGAAFVYLADKFLSYLGIHQTFADSYERRDRSATVDICEKTFNTNNNKLNNLEKEEVFQDLRQRKKIFTEKNEISDANSALAANYTFDTWRRVFLLIVAVTVHNIPEGLAVGVGFGAVGKSSSATFESARNLALGKFCVYSSFFPDCDIFSFIRNRNPELSRRIRSQLAIGGSWLQ